MRESGILFHITSLPSPYGIGTLGKAAYEFVDFLKKSGQSYWQVLPIGPTSYGDSPYQSFSAFAGNPYFIDLDILIEEKLLLIDECEEYKRPVSENIDYKWLYDTRFKLYKKAYKRFLSMYSQKEFDDFKKEKSFWLNDYALFMAIKGIMPEGNWLSWDCEYAKKESNAIRNFSKNHFEEIDFWKFIQYTFFRQWNSLKEYANDKGIKIIGDMPIYVAYDSSDVWSDPKNWLLDEELKPTAVAGVPPDFFAVTGQLWGNPIYNYELMKKNGYDWWITRISESFKLFDVVRIDHFRGFESFYSIPAGDKTAEFGKWEKGPGIDLFNKIKEKLGDLDIIAEDLGFLTEDVYELLRQSGFPGMKILQFGFDPNGDSEYLPHNYTNNSICYTGTHDNMTLKEWLQDISKEGFNFVCEYLDVDINTEIDIIIDKLIKLLLSSVSKIAIIPLRDYLHLGKEGRFNIPSTLGGNWVWRATEAMLTDKLAEKICKFTKVYRR